MYAYNSLTGRSGHLPHHLSLSTRRSPGGPETAHQIVNTSALHARAEGSDRRARRAAGNAHADRRLAGSLDASP